MGTPPEIGCYFPKHPLGHCPECLSPGMAQNRSTGKITCANKVEQHYYDSKDAISCRCPVEKSDD